MITVMKSRYTIKTANKNDRAPHSWSRVNPIANKYTREGQQ